ADVIGLMCLRPDPERIAGTLLTSTAMFLPLLDPQTISILHQPRFATTVDGSFLRGAGIKDPILVGPIRVLSGSLRRPPTRCDFAETSGLDGEAQAALDALYDATWDSIVTLRLEPGVTVVVTHYA